ncbi:MAG: hypothetical protein ABFD91_17275 [Anaerohalosphaeraceae bacterium]
MFRFFFSRPVSNQISSTLIRGSILGGLFLIGFGLLVFVLRDLFAFLAAAIFFLAGFSAIGYGIRMWIVMYKVNKSDKSYRENVTIHYKE